MTVSSLEITSLPLCTHSRLPERLGSPPCPPPCTAMHWISAYGTAPSSGPLTSPLVVSNLTYSPTRLSTEQVCWKLCPFRLIRTDVRPQVFQRDNAIAGWTDSFTQSTRSPRITSHWPLCFLWKQPLDSGPIFTSNEKRLLTCSLTQWQLSPLCLHFFPSLGFLKAPSPPCK